MISGSEARKRAREWPHPRHEDFEKALRKAAGSWFRKRELATRTKQDYILKSRDQWPENLVDPAIADYVNQRIGATKSPSDQDDDEAFPLHKYIHHGLSSQAMLFNLVGPLILAKDLAPLREALEDVGVPWPGEGSSLDLEYAKPEVLGEVYGQPTSVDLVVKNSGGDARVFIEAKFVEREFGGCSVFGRGDCDGRNPAQDHDYCYLHHIGRQYWTLLEKHELTNGPIGESPLCSLASYYQFFRELLLAFEAKGTFVLLCDARNPTFECSCGERGLWPFLKSLLPDVARQRMAKVTIQDVVAKIEASGRHPWVEEFKEKYAIGEDELGKCARQ